jgi:hypothetical protein
MVLNSGFIDFTSVRVLDPNDTNSKVLTLGEKMDMIWAFESYVSSSAYNGVNYHGSQKSYPDGW